MVVGSTPTARAMRAEPWPITCRARSRSRVPPASTRSRGMAELVRATTVAVAPGCAAAAGEQGVHGGRDEAGGGDAGVGAAVLAQAAGVVAGGVGTGAGLWRSGRWWGGRS